MRLQGNGIFPSHMTQLFYWLGTSRSKKFSLAERLFLEEKPASKWPLCKGRETDKGEPPRQIKLLMWTYLMILKCTLLLK